MIDPDFRYKLNLLAFCASIVLLIIYPLYVFFHLASLGPREMVCFGIIVASTLYNPVAHEILQKWFKKR